MGRRCVILYTAYIVGSGKKLEAAELDALFAKLKREHIDVRKPEQLRAHRLLSEMREAIIRGNRSLSHREMLNRHFRNPFRVLRTTDDVQMKI